VSAVARHDRALAPTPPGGLRRAVRTGTITTSVVAPPRAAAKPALRPVAAPVASRSLVPFVSLCIAIIVGSLVGVLLLNTQMAQGAYDTRDLKIQIASLSEQRGELVAQLDSNAAPQNLADRAAALGMHPAGKVGFISLEDGYVTGAGGHR
jgi:hypothetical protein